MEITFKADADAIRNAFDVIRIITPMGVTEQGEAGFLCSVGKKVDKNPDGSPGPSDGKDFCWVYSRDGTRAARAEFPITDVEGDGTFAYPVEHIETFKFVNGELTFKVTTDADANIFLVTWSYGAGAGTERASFNSLRLTSLDKRFNEATNHHTYRTSILKEALSGGKAFLASEKDKNAKDEYKIINVYDPTMDKSGKGDGTLHSTDGYQRFYFHCEQFKGRGLQVHFDHIGHLEAFLAKCGPEIVICTGSDMTYAMTPDKTQVFGFGKHTKPALEYKVLPRSWDKVVLLVKDREFLVQQLRFINAELPKDRDKVKIEYDNDAAQIRFRIVAGGKATSLPIDVERAKDPEGKEIPGASYSHDVNVKQMLGLFEGVKAKVVEFRMFLMEEHGGPKGGAGFRTVDEFLLDKEGKVVGGSGATPDPANGVYQCKVTRFMPSKV